MYTSYTWYEILAELIYVPVNHDCILKMYYSLSHLLGITWIVGLLFFHLPGYLLYWIQYVYIQECEDADQYHSTIAKHKTY